MRFLLTGMVICLLGLAPAEGVAGGGPRGGGRGRGHAPPGMKPASKKQGGKKQGDGKRTGKSAAPLKKPQMLDRLGAAAANKNLPAAQRGALFAGLSGFPLSESQRNALSELAADDRSELTSEDREAVNQLLEEDAQRSDRQLAADSNSADNPTSPTQVGRFLLLRNDSGEPLTVRVHFRRQTKRGDWNWFPADPGTSAKALEYTLNPGKALYLSDGRARVATSKVRIWAESAKSGSRWLDYKDHDLWLVPELGEGSDHHYHGDKVETVAMRLTRPERSQELLMTLARR